MNNKILIGLCGGKGEGKDTFAKYLIEHYGFIRVAYGDALYEEVAEAYGTTVEALNERATKETPQPQLALRCCKDPAFVRVMLELRPNDIDVQAYLQLPRSPRWTLQYWGTEYRRAQNDRYWLDIVERKLETISRAVVTDVRYPNELELVLQRGGLARRVELFPAVVRDEAAGHLSERALDGYHIPTVKNVWGDLVPLQQQIDGLMAEYKLPKAA